LGQGKEQEATEETEAIQQKEAKAATRGEEREARGD
jgi:hypothetical protein